ncbi:mCG146030, isoform CRA_b, partial [Mus musculus]
GKLVSEVCPLVQVLYFGQNTRKRASPQTGNPKYTLSAWPMNHCPWAVPLPCILRPLRWTCPSQGYQWTLLWARPAAGVEHTSPCPLPSQLLPDCRVRHSAASAWEKEELEIGAHRVQTLPAWHPSASPLLTPPYLFLWSLDRKWVFRLAESMKYLLQECRVRERVKG